VTLNQGEAKFVGPYSFDVKGPMASAAWISSMHHCGQDRSPALLPGLPDDPRVTIRAAALELPRDCKRLLVIGGGPSSAWRWPASTTRSV